MLHEYPAIVDKVRVTLVTDAAEVERRLAIAGKSISSATIGCLDDR